MMSFDSCHLWVSSRSRDMGSVFLFLFFYYYFVYLFISVPTTEGRRGPLETMIGQKETRRQFVAHVSTHKLFLEALYIHKPNIMFTIMVLQYQSEAFNTAVS